ncbi:hypothetical protein K505DRAFT_320303 [Melanomma pulvis-pyrius CBS 109.77]|uniref:PHD-type domain-containing protein n=1 Tax=Melanomma pulvis-pyrius CBS 109.77 TaxID=1314802 RepID=A0A6A6XXA9_9PLEO|nr:hypothetical protein K505DRAFT_320303 [Melanomma pulvis-pyrius CBS 109.77]
MPPAAGPRTAGAATASDRRQSTRQGRTTVRPTNYYARTFAGRLAANGLEQTPEASNTASGFLPALTHFTQAVDAFPKELIKHFSMFKEVEAKFHDPEHELKLLFDEIARLPVTTKAQQRVAARNHTGGANSANVSVSGSSMQDGAARHQQLALELFPADFARLPPEEQADLKKRQLFYRLRIVVASMIPTLDEKLVVLTSAKTTKDKGLARMNNSYPHLDSEISEEARYGSLSHWAYADKEEKKKGGASHERHRREVVSANNLAAAAQHVHDADSIAAKSEARREAMLANKRSRQQHIDSDFDDRPAKKTQKRKAIAADAAAADARGIGLGITANGIAPQGKRKKTEKALAAAVAAAPPMERSLSSALKAAGTGARNGTSPRATPGTDNGGTGPGSGKRKPRAHPAPTQRKHALPVYSPPLASSPIAPSFAVSKSIAAERPGSSRARKNSTTNSVASAALEPPIGRRPSSSHSVRQLISSNAIVELEQASGIIRDNVSTKDEPTPKEPTDFPAPLEPAALKHEEAEIQEPESMDIDVPVPAPVTTRAGRTSKTATPIVGTFPDLPMMARSRSTRNANNGNGGGSNSHASSENNSTTTGAVSKRGGHKKNAPSVTAAPVPSPALKPTIAATKSNPPSSTASSVAPDPEFSAGEEDEDGDEPRYCYCNEVSYGNMIACDYSECPREWFHLACVNMEKAPNARTKWFCSDECKEANARAKPKGGRPGSSNKQ